MLLFTKLIDKLRRPIATHYLLRLHFFFLRIDNRMKSSYANLIEKMTYEAQIPTESAEHPPVIGSPKDGQEEQDENKAGNCMVSLAISSSSKTGADHQKLHQSGNELTEAAAISNWHNFPKPLPGTGGYTKFSNCLMVYAVLRIIFRDQLIELLDLSLGKLLNLRGNCMLLGRIVFHPAISELSAMIFPLNNLIWRANNALSNRQLKLTMVDFLFYSDEKMQFFYRLLEEEQKLDYSGIKWRTSIRLSTSVNGCRGARSPPSGKATTQANVQVGSPRSIALEEQFMRYAMCYQVKYGKRTCFRLRPNRTPRAHSQLLDQAAKSFIIITVLLILFVMIITAIFTLLLLSDRRYVCVYPGCSRELDELVARNELPSMSITFTGHHLVSSIVDGLEGIVIWGDCIFAMLYGPTFCYLLNYDLLLYWSSLQTKLESLLDRVHDKNLLRADWSEELIDESSDELSTYVVKFHMMERQYHDPYLKIESYNKRSEQEDSDPRLKVELFEFQFEMYDFFQEVGRVDVLISDVLTLSIYIWLSSCVMVGSNFVTADKGASIPALVRFVLISGFTVFITASHFLLTLRRRCLVTYRTLNSLLAGHQGNEKRHLLKLMDFFTSINRTTYTLAHHIPYQPTTFITILGYTASCLLIALNLFSYRKQAGGGGEPIEARSHDGMLASILHELQID